jgi:hypothetical protein
MYWRILTRGDLPTPIRRAGTVWAAAALLLCAGTPVLFLVHTWFTERSVSSNLQQRLTSEQTNLLSTEEGRINTAVAKLSESPELTSNQFAIGDPLLLATVQRLAVSEQLPYLVLLDKDLKVLARSQPVAAFGDTWPVSLTGVVTGNASGLALSERGTPLLLSSHSVKFGATEHVFTLVGGIQIDQNFLSTRSKELKAPLFLTSDEGVIALAAPEGNALNALSSQSIDTFLAQRTGKSGSFSLASDTKRYQVQTLPLTSADGHVVATLGTAELDTSTDFRLRLDLIVMIGLAVLVLALPAIAWRRREEVAV